MRMIGIVAFLGLVILPFDIAWCEGPAIVFDKETHDYGKVLYGNTVKESFAVTNEGNQTLVIEKLDASCGCTKAIKGKSEVPPNGKTTIVVEFDTNGLRSGRKEKSIFVHSNDPARPVVKLTLLADVVKDLNVEPPSLAKQLPTFAGSISFPMKITNSSDKPCIVKGIKSQPGEVAASLSPARIICESHGLASFSIIVKLEKEPDRYYYMGRLTLETDHPRETEIEIRYLIKLGNAE